MRKPHFFKARSRIGLANPPYRQKTLNIGVEEGPDAVLTTEFLSTFPQCKVSEFTFPNPEYVDKAQFIAVLAKHLEDFKKLILHNVEKNEVQVVVGGDHGITFSSIAATLEKCDASKVGYIHIDSHPDANTAASSPTQNFHGMYLRPFLADFDIPQISALVKTKILSENVLFIGNLDIDPGEQVLFHKMGMRNISKKEINEDFGKVRLLLDAFIRKYEHIHVNFDIDCLDKTVAPATGIPAKRGLLLPDVLPLLRIIAKHPRISFDLVEVNPKKKGAKKTIAVAQEILSIILS